MWEGVQHVSYNITDVEISAKPGLWTGPWTLPTLSHNDMHSLDMSFIGKTWY